jgi:hypothetical protein
MLKIPRVKQRLSCLKFRLKSLELCEDLKIVVK